MVGRQNWQNSGVIWRTEHVEEEQTVLVHVWLLHYLFWFNSDYQLILANGLPICALERSNVRHENQCPHQTECPIFAWWWLHARCHCFHWCISALGLIRLRESEQRSVASDFHLYWLGSINKRSKGNSINFMYQCQFTCQVEYYLACENSCRMTSWALQLC